jgi:hypothetical protein
MTRIRRGDNGRLFTGLMLIGLGTLFLLEQFHIAGFHAIFRTWWPMIIVMFGVSSLVGRGRVWSGLWTIAIGVWLQLIQLRMFDLTFRNSWPLLLIVLGAFMTLRALTDTVGGTSEGDRNVR